PTVAPVKVEEKVEPKPEEEDITDKAKAFGHRITGFFKKGTAHSDYPVSEAYEGPLDHTTRRNELDGTPLSTHVSVYHSGKSDEPTVAPVKVEEKVEPKPEEEDITDKAKAFGHRITGFFKKGTAHSDYPVSEAYEGPLDHTTRRNELDGTPLSTHVSVYHSGKSDEPTTAPVKVEEKVEPKPEEEDITDKAKAFGHRITGFFKKGTAHSDYPVSEAYEGPLDHTTRRNELDGTPLSTHVSVYHSGKS
ncbi:hypothetical protein FO519_010592, partial [Halicephalobus sp. NKZ332]